MKINNCYLTRRQGAEHLETAVVPMWVIYQFLGINQTKLNIDF